jgi:hypothetical protein
MISIDHAAYNHFQCHQQSWNIFCHFHAYLTNKQQEF